MFGSARTGSSSARYPTSWTIRVRWFDSGDFSVAGEDSVEEGPFEQPTCWPVGVDIWLLARPNQEEGLPKHLLRLAELEHRVSEDVLCAGNLPIDAEGFHAGGGETWNSSPEKGHDPADRTRFTPREGGDRLLCWQTPRQEQTRIKNALCASLKRRLLSSMRFAGSRAA